MENRLRILSERLLRKSVDELSDSDRRVLKRVAEAAIISRDLSAERSGFGDRVADQVAAFGGSWTFIFSFGGVLVAWVLLNVLVLRGAAPDPYPFVFLNLILSTVAAFQAPVIMMSQNRQAAKDREAAAHDYEVNLKAEIEIMRLHEKLDDLRMVAMQQRFDAVETRLAAIEAGLAGLRSAPGSGPV